jgi:hypothetical protein
MQTLYSYDSMSLTAQCRTADRLREAAREHRIAAAPRPSAWRLLAATGQWCIQTGERLQRLGQPTAQTTTSFVEEQVSW